MRDEIIVFVLLDGLYIDHLFCLEFVKIASKIVTLWM